MNKQQYFLRGAYVSEAMAKALFMENFGGCNLPSRDKRFLSAPRHSQSQRDFAKKMVEKYSVILANAKEDYLVQDAIDHISDYKKMAVHGLYSPCHHAQVAAAIKIRALKSDARKCRRIAYALCESFADRESLGFVALTAPTYLDYKEWAKAA